MSALTRGGRATAETPARGLIADTAFHPVGTDFFGVNGARIISPLNARQWHDPAFLDRLAAVGPRLLRVQGGTTSQWIDWRTGRFVERSGSSFATANDGRPPLTLEDWAFAVRRIGATPIFDLNVATSTLAEQIAQLHAAERLGMPVRYLELGNEIWMPMSPYTELYPTGADYARVMNDWIVVLRKEFPQARIGVPAADDALGSALGERYRTWNQGLFDTIRGADAAVFHPYWIVDPVRADISSTAAGGTVAWTELSRALPKVPAAMSIWITEYNQMGREGTPPLTMLPALQQTWAVALGVAAFTLRALCDPKVEMAVLHCALNGAPGSDTSGGGTTNQAVHALISDGTGGSEVFGRTAHNVALTPIYDSLRADSTVRMLSLDTPVEVPALLLVPAYAGTVSAFTGVELSSPEGTSAVLLNAGAEPIRITLPEYLSGEAEIYCAPPGAAPAFVAGDTIPVTRIRASGSIELPAYSETVLRGSPAA
ncbi:hypothetical protein [Nocardia inohanensis]|uniref:hypothetical protein n=1 Tax=Nocardia inohanensis TaxID=209246 RepID=UPI000830226A|nr:hypothetical protein [Nocardia inohanensis]